MLFQQIASNKRKTVGIMGLFVIILALVGAGLGYLFGNRPVLGLIIAVVFSLIYMLIVLPNPANMVMSLNHAQEVQEQDNPELWHVVQDMALVGRVPMPRVFIIDDPSPNAFATGRDPNHSAVAVTQGLLDMMNREELEGVLGHEISVLILGPICASLAQMALSRNREYLADASSVELTRNPQGLISALEKIDGSEPMKKADPSSAGMYSEDPVRKKRSFAHLFDSHPPTADRISRLEKM